MSIAFVHLVYVPLPVNAGGRVRETGLCDRLALRYISAALKTARVPCRVWDRELDPFSLPALVEPVRSGQSAIAFFATPQTGEDICVLIASLRTRGFAQPILVMGQPGESVDRLLDAGADAALFGEPEQTMVEWIDAYNQGRRHPDVPGVAFA